MTKRADSSPADGNRIIQLRLGKGWTRTELSQVSGVSLSTVGRAEHGERIRANILAEIAEALGVAPRDILRAESGHQDQPLAISSDPETGTPAALKPHLRSFDSFMADRTRGFVGRRFVFDAIDRFLADPDVHSGYFLVSGTPGIGKSALLSKFIRDRHLAVYHFNIAVDGITTPEHALGNLCTRLILEFDLPHASLPERFAGSSAFISTLLHEVSPRVSQKRPLVIAVDALDEANTDFMPSGANTLFLPTSLPEGVYVILTARQDSPVCLEASTIGRFTIAADSAENTADLEQYIASWLKHDGVQKWIRRDNSNDADFVASMLDLSEGNFMYLRHVLPAIEEGLFSEGSLEDLPRGLLDYYRRHWEIMRARAPEEFEEVYIPVICVLAAVQRAWPVDEVARITKLPIARVSKVIRSWHEFFETVRERGRKPSYRPYHSTFAEYLSDEVDRGLETYHRLIANSLLDQANPDSPES